MEKQANRPLKAGCLNFTEVTAIAIALISPTMTGALIIVALVIPPMPSKR
jgi:hypothetical protein